MLSDLTRNDPLLKSYKGSHDEVNTKDSSKECTQRICHRNGADSFDFKQRVMSTKLINSADPNCDLPKFSLQARIKKCLIQPRILPHTHPTPSIQRQISQLLLCDIAEGKIEEDDAKHIEDALKQASLTNTHLFQQKSLSARDLELVVRNIDPEFKPKAYKYFQDTFVLMQAVVGWKNATRGWGSLGRGSRMDDSVVNMLFLAPLKTGSGNYTTAGRIKKHFEGRNVSFYMRNTTSFTCSTEFKDYLKENDIHIILGLHLYHAGYWLRYVDPEEIPYAVIFGGTDVNEFHKIPEKNQVMTHVILQSSALVVFCEQMQRKAKTIWPVISKCEIIEIPQAVETTPASRNVLDEIKSKHNIHADDRCFVLVAGIRPVKDPLYLIQAFSEWHQLHNQTVHLIIIGHVVDNEYAETFYNVVDGCPGVLYLGGMTIYETHAIIRDSFALINSSRSEGMCTAILEAMDLGVPVIARNIPGNRAIVQHKETGMLFSDPQEFIEAAETLMTNTKVRKNIIQNAHTQISQNHNLENEHKAYRSLFDMLNSLRPKFRPAPIEEENSENVAENGQEDTLNDMTISSTTMNLAAVAAANNVSLDPKPKVLKRKGSKGQLNIGTQLKENSLNEIKCDKKKTPIEKTSKTSTKNCIANGTMKKKDTISPLNSFDANMSVKLSPKMTRKSMESTKKNAAQKT